MLISLFKDRALEIALALASETLQGEWAMMRGFVGTGNPVRRYGPDLPR